MYSKNMRVHSSNFEANNNRKKIGKLHKHPHPLIVRYEPKKKMFSLLHGHILGLWEFSQMADRDPEVNDP